MRSAIDSAGRLVIPKTIRDAMGLTPGAPIDVSFVDGRIEIEFEPSAIRADVAGDMPTLASEEALPPLTDETIRATLDAVRR